ncbi:MAG: hypothetical protein CVT70_19825 [Alphaproteobacteria bacterium HGW-Alphaproteobacteria-1]|jgi:hypothetical protein|nr:MAG: hypothetical protein CVT70_19825 [Alphaproteobacteria bacterium HGW-Alphaproteobacteria-1]
MGLNILAFLWFAGMAGAVAFAVRAGGQRGVFRGIWVVLACLVLLQIMHFSANHACMPGNCGDLGLLLDRIRITLGALTLAGGGAGVVLGLYVLAPRGGRAGSS